MSPREPGKNALAFILITIALDAIGFGLIVPVLPALLKELLGASAAEAAPWGGILAFVYAVMSFLFSPLLGNLSDRFGRRPILLLSLASLCVDYLIMGFAHSIWLLVVGRILSGASGATQATAKAYITDTTSLSDRTRAFGLIGAAFGVGFVLGPAIGGILGDISPRAPFFAAAGLAFANVLYGWLVLPETLPSSKRRTFDLSRANPLRTFARLGKIPRVGWLLTSVLLFHFAHVVYPATWSFHGDARYGWDPQQIGFSLMAVGIGFTIVQGGLIGPIAHRLGNGRTAIIGVLCNVAGFVGFAFASQEWMVYLWIIAASLGAVGGPAVASLMTARVAEDAQGELQGAVSSVQAVSNMIAPLVMTQTFSFFAADAYYGAAFLLAAGLTLLSLVPLGLGLRESRQL